MKVQKDDTVKVLLGKDRNKTGKVLRVFSKTGKVTVEGVNVYKRHIKRTGQMEGGTIDLTKPVNISNVAVVCPGCKKTSRVGYKIEGKNKVRVCLKCKEVLNAKTKR